jgi:glycosyltransferase involved in cell wall biosynthesis
MPLACKYGLAAAALARVPAVVATEHLFVDVTLRSSVMVEWLVSLGVDRYLAVSREVANRLLAQLNLPKRKMRVVHNGIPLERFEHPAGQRAPQDRTVVLTIARLTPQKGIAYLIEAASRLPGVLFLVAGEGPERKTLEAQARSKGVSDRVLFLGQREDIPDLLGSCDLFVLPSLFEGLPISVMEAMAAGRAVIATNAGGTGELISNCETGLLIPPADVDALTRAVATLIADRALRERLAGEGRARIRSDFSAAAMVTQVTNVYQEILRARGMA